MIKFTEMQYAPIEMDAWEKDFYQNLERFKSAEFLQDKLLVLNEINQLRNDFETMRVLSSTRHSIDTVDAYYDAQNQLFDTIAPQFEQAIDALYGALLDDPLADLLEKALGSHLFQLMRLKRSTFNPAIMGMLETENKLVSDYTKLRSSIRIAFEGQELNIPQMEPHLQAVDRAKRKRAHEALEAAFEAKADEFEALYDDLVKVRHQIAKTLGYETFTPLGYARLGRTDYGPDAVAQFRDAVLTQMVPKLKPLYAAQQKRLGVEHLHYYDLSLEFLDGNPTPKGDSAWILAGGAAMYEDLSPETHRFFQEMLQGELMDLEAKSGKAGGGYCTYIPNYRAPFIFANFNGTMGDIDVLTHEAGHAYQVYKSRDHVVPEYLWPTLEACEIHSMSMEYLTYPYMERFFKEDTAKYFYAHMSGSIRFVPYGVLVDHYQHWVYANPEATPAERRATWADLERQYLPHKDYSENPFLASGTYWLRQGHIFMDPFYYIDYTLAAMCALQFWLRAEVDRSEALAAYDTLCALGGSRPFTALLSAVSLASPFDAQAVGRAVDAALAFIEGQEAKL